LRTSWMLVMSNGLMARQFTCVRRARTGAGCRHRSYRPSERLSPLPAHVEDSGSNRKVAAKSEGALEKVPELS